MTAATTITPRDEMRAKLERAKTIAKAAENANRDFTASEHSEVKQLLADVERIKANIAAAKADSDLLATLKEIAVPADGNEPGTGIAAKGSGSLFADPSAVAAGTVARLGTAGVGLKALNPSGSITFAERPLGAVAIPERSTRILDLLGTVDVDGPEVPYLRQTARANSAAPVAYGALKPTSVYSVEKVTATVRTFAHLSEPLPRQHFEDDVSLEEFIGHEMVGGLLDVVAGQVVSGDGIGENLEGVLSTSGTLAQAFAVDALTSLRKALTQLETASVDPTAYVLNPADWEQLELLAGNDGHHVFGGLPAELPVRRLFGVPVHLSPHLVAGTAVLADWRQIVLLRRGAGALSWTEVHGDDWSKNLVRWRAEMRLGLAVKVPSTAVVVDLTAA